LETRVCVDYCLETSGWHTLYMYNSVIVKQNDHPEHVGIVILIVFVYTDNEQKYRC